MNKNLSELLQQTLLGATDETPLQRYKKSLLTNWPQISGKLSLRMRIERVYERVIVIGVYDTAWMQELYCMSELILHQINQYLGTDYFQELKFRYVNRLAKKSVANLTGTQTANAVGDHLTAKPALVPITDPDLRRALTQITDPELQHELHRFFTRCRNTYT